ncbi:MAG: serine/threonine protein kinase [Myxococcota bacterium]|jgi:serine/threonine protein kinase
MGEVRRVRDRRLGCELSMKLLSRKLVHSDSARSRFLREVRVTARLSHPSIVSVQDWGSWRTGGCGSR